MEREVDHQAQPVTLHCSYLNGKTGLYEIQFALQSKSQNAQGTPITA